MTRYEFVQAISRHFDEDNLMEYFDENGERNDVSGWLLVDPIIQLVDATWRDIRSGNEEELIEAFAANVDMLANNLGDVAYSVSTVVR